MQKEIPKLLVDLQPTDDRILALSYWDGVLAFICLPGTPSPDWLPALSALRRELASNVNWPNER